MIGAMSTEPTAEIAKALLPTAAAAVADAYSAILEVLTDGADALDVVARMQTAGPSITQAETDLLCLAAVAGAPTTPAAHGAGIAPATLRQAVAGVRRQLHAAVHA